MLRDDLTDKDAGTFDIVSLVKSEHIYGGYYNSYADEGTPYTGESSKWNFDEAYTVSGFKMTPVPGKTYYLKEVPNKYLRPAAHEMFWQKAKYITQFYLVSVIDDGNYLTTGFDGTNFENESLGDKDLRGAANPATMVYSKVLQGTSTYWYPNNYASVKNGYLSIYAAHYNLDEPMTDGKKTTYTPYYVTPDNIKVWQQSRRGTVASNGTIINYQVTKIATKLLENIFDNPVRILTTKNAYDSSIKYDNNSNSSGSNGSSSSGNNGSSSSGSNGSSSSGSNGSSSSGSNGTSNASVSNTGSSSTESSGVDATDIHKTDQSSGNSSENEGTGNNQSDTGSDPNASLQQDKQSGNSQQDEGSWSEESSSASYWWIWPAALAVCGGFWFFIWKRKKDDDEEEGRIVN